MDYVVKHIPVDKFRRPGTKIIPQYITIHSTANLHSSALSERNWLINPNNKVKASWHIAVDEKMCVEAIPLDEKTIHTNNKNGNITSISIEICESGNRVKTLQNAVKLIVRLLKERNWGVNRLRRHFDWSGKICPRIFAENDWAEWKTFKIAVEKELNISKVKVNIKGKIYNLDGFLKDGVNYVPIRAVAEALGYKVGWQDGTVIIE